MVIGTRLEDSFTRKIQLISARQTSEVKCIFNMDPKMDPKMDTFGIITKQDHPLSPSADLLLQAILVVAREIY